MLRKLSCPTIQEPPWQSHMHHLSWDRSPFTATRPTLNTVRPGLLTDVPRFFIAESQTSRPLKLFNLGATTNKITARAGASEEGPRAKEILGFFPFRVSARQVWASSAPAVSLSARSPGRRHRSPGPLLRKGRHFTAPCLRLSSLQN